MTSSAQQWLDEARARRVEDALHEIVTAAVERDNQPRLAPGSGHAMTLDEIGAISGDDHGVDDWVNDPVGTAYRSGITQLGKHLYRLTSSIEAMGATAERVAQREPSSYGHRATIIDKAWDGIGEGDDRWWA